jgi:hypothetical protein
LPAIVAENVGLGEKLKGSTTPGYARVPLHGEVMLKNEIKVISTGKLLKVVE